MVASTKLSEGLKAGCVSAIAVKNKGQSVLKYYNPEDKEINYIQTTKKRSYCVAAFTYFTEV